MYSIEAIKSRLNSYDVVDLLGLETVNSGKTTFIRCPEPNHPDKHIGSCRISERGYFCYSCGKFGSVIDLYAKSKGISFSCAINELGDRMNLSHSECTNDFPLSKDDKSALGVENSRSLAYLWNENREAYDYALYNLIQERLTKLTEIQKSISRHSPNFIKIKNDEVLWRINNLISEQINHLKGMCNEL